MPLSRRAGLGSGPHLFVQATIALAVLSGVAAPASAAPRTVLVVSEARDFVHDSIPAARAALHRLESARLRVRDIRAADVTRAGLRGADAVIFVHTTGELPVDRRALRRFVRRGGGLVGFHAATDAFQSWPGWERLIGGRFVRHDAPAVETVRIRRGHAAVRGVPRTFRMHEEYYRHEPGVARRARVLATWGDERLPLVWVRTPGRGRVFYSALGHFSATWTDPRHEALVRSGLRWVLRR